MLIIENRGQAITNTNYWDSPHAKAGLFYLSWNAGAGRLLVPDACKAALREMKSARCVIVSRGRWRDQGGRDALELLFEDDSASPFCLHLSLEQADRLIPDREQGVGFAIVAWPRGGEKLRWPGQYRVVEEIPCLAPWSEQ